MIEDAGHFLQEDAGERIGNPIADWLRARGRGEIVKNFWTISPSPAGWAL